jgi:hypothetical protein
MGTSAKIMVKAHHQNIWPGQPDKPAVAEQIQQQPSHPNPRHQTTLLGPDHQEGTPDQGLAQQHEQEG